MVLGEWFDGQVRVLAPGAQSVTVNGAPATLAPDANLTSDLNLSSIDRVELVSAIEDRLQIDVNESRVAEATTVAELEKLLREAPAERSDHHYPHPGLLRIDWLPHLIRLDFGAT